MRYFQYKLGRGTLSLEDKKGNLIPATPIKNILFISLIILFVLFMIPVVIVVAPFLYFLKFCIWLLVGKDIGDVKVVNRENN